MPFLNIVDESKAIKGMDSPKYWRDEAPGICNWALVGLHRLLQNNRFTKSEVCDQVSRSYRTESSPVATFLSECVESRPSSYIPSSDLYERYASWSRKNGYDRISDVRVLGKEVESMFGSIRNRMSTPGRPRVYQNIGYVTSEDEVDA